MSITAHRRSLITPVLPSAEEIDATYGLEPVIEPGQAGDLGVFATVDCPYCGERFATPVDISHAAFCYIEDCQICCQPIELSGSFDDRQQLQAFDARRLD